jgi:hypothetical protein
VFLVAVNQEHVLDLQLFFLFVVLLDVPYDFVGEHATLHEVFMMLSHFNFEFVALVHDFDLFLQSWKPLFEAF